ncbi:MAG: AsmA-like C-terminal region-containing protein [Microvirga sp.]|nr:AsmA-like C-terminal region-containing protein [Microvirga sp.]
MRILRGAVALKIGLLVILSLATGALYWRLTQAPLRLDGLSGQVTAALAARVGDDWRISIDDSAVTLVDGGLGMEVEGLDLRDASGRLVARAPSAVVAISTGSLIAGSPAPRGVELRDTELRLRIANDGSISLSPPDDGIALAPPAPVSGPAEPIPFAPPTASGVVIAGLLGALIDPRGPLGAIDYAALKNARITLIDENGRERAAFRRVDALFATAGSGRRFDAEFEGDAGTWRVSGAVRPDGSGGKRARLAVENIPLVDVFLFGGLSPVAEARDLRFGFAAEISIGANGEVHAFTAEVEGEPGTIRLDDPNTPLLSIGAFSANLDWDAERGVVEIADALYAAGDTRVRLDGALTPDEDGNAWRLDLRSQAASLSGAAEGDAPVAIESIQLLAHGGQDGLVVEELALRGPKLDAAVTLSFGARADEGGLRVALEARETGVREALRVWPEFVAPTVRGFLVETLSSGTLDRLTLATVITAEDFRAMRRREGLPHESVDIDFAITDATFTPNRDLPPMTRAHFAGSVLGRSARIDDASALLPLEEGRVLALTGGGFVMEDFWRPGERAAIDFRLGGGADALAALLRTPIIARAEQVNLSPDDISGEIDLGVSLAIALNAPPDPAAIPIRVEGDVTDLRLRSVFGEDDLTDGAFTMTYRDGSLDLRGRARLAEDMADVALAQVRGGGGEATINLTLDDAARRRRGIDLGSALTGPIPVVIRTRLSGDEGMRVEADLSQARIDNLVPGWVKPSGQAGFVSMTIRSGERPRLEGFSLEAGTARIVGDLDIAAAGGLAAAELSTLRISPGDEARATISNDGGVWRATVRANVMDARPFLALLSQERTGEAEGAMARLELDLRAEIMTGHNGESLTGAELSLSLRPGTIRDFALRGRFPGAAVAARKTLAASGESAIVVESGDAGATLRFIDLYTRMGGGQLDFQIATDGEAQPGRLVIRDFVLRDEPALSTLVSQQPQRSRPGGEIDYNAARFEQARADFVRRGGRLDLSEAVMWGAEIGFRLDGYLDQSQRNLDIRGTFVPAFGINNAFAQVPLIGMILGGGRHEGLIGINFRVSGSLDAPTLTVNPLSAIAPGFLRRLFEAGGAAPYQPPPATTPQAPPAPPLQISPGQ